LLQHPYHQDELPAAFMPLTLRVDDKLKAISFRAGYADLPEANGGPTTPRPINRFPSGKDSDVWLPWCASAK
jgi:hypothetical protein